MICPAFLTCVNKCVQNISELALRLLSKMSDDFDTEEVSDGVFVN